MDPEAVLSPDRHRGGFGQARFSPGHYPAAGQPGGGGTLRFSVQTAGTADLPIPQGTVCLTAGLVAFATTQEGVLAAGRPRWTSLPRRWSPPRGNVPAGTVQTMSVAPVGIAACTNPVPFTGGREEEGDEALRERVLATYRQLPNGANKAYYAQQALGVEGVTAVTVLPKARGWARWTWWSPGPTACRGRTWWTRSRPSQRPSGRSPWTSRSGPPRR